MAQDDPFAPLLDEDAFDRNLNIRILRLASSLMTIFQRSTLRDAQVSAQEYRILVSIARHGGGHLRDLSRKASISAAHASRAMKGMQDKGWLERNPHPTDRRLAVFTMTDEGQRVFMTIYPAADALAQEFAGLFSDEEAVQFRDMLDRARAHAGKLLDAADD
jgi:DNA-binding MarR family transcriptional regulator